MGKSLMHDLYFGNLVPWERGRSQDSAYTSITRKFSDKKVHFKGLLSPDEYNRVKNILPSVSVRFILRQNQLHWYVADC